MYQVPTHIKSHVDRIVIEYQRLYHQGHKVALQIFRDNHIYSGIETTEYYLNSVKKFRKLLDDPKGRMFTGTEEEIRKRIYAKICDFYKELSAEAILRINCKVECQIQLETTLRAARRMPSLAAEAKSISWFIENGKVLSWGKRDEQVKVKIFKLIKTEEKFKKLLNQEDDYPIVEITQEGISQYSKIRIALQVIDIKGMYKKQMRTREYQNFWNGPHDVNEFETECIIFNMWNDIAETGIYYVYIPED